MEDRPEARAIGLVHQHARIGGLRQLHGLLRYAVRQHREFRRNRCDNRQGRLVGFQRRLEFRDLVNFDDRNTGKPGAPAYRRVRPVSGRDERDDRPSVRQRQNSSDNACAGPVHHSRLFMSETTEMLDRSLSEVFTKEPRPDPFLTQLQHVLLADRIVPQIARENTDTLHAVAGNEVRSKRAGMPQAPHLIGR